MEIVPCIGQKFGMLTITEFLGLQQFGDQKHTCVRVLCDCGNAIVLPLTRVRRLDRSCGCRKHCGGFQKTHGGRHTRLYNVWVGMRNRCDNPKAPKYPRYGARGISVCPEWYDFAVFREWAESNGYADDLTLDRQDNDGNYEPSNCRWATPMQQSHNTRRNIFLTAFGETKTVSEWARDARCPIKSSSLNDRVRKGMPHEQAITLPATRGLGT